MYTTESIHETNSQGLTQETSQQRLIRREKLAKLQEEGNDPFQITRYVVDNDSANIWEHFDTTESIMLLTNSDTIREVILFPTMKTLD